MAVMVRTATRKRVSREALTGWLFALPILLYFTIWVFAPRIPQWYVGPNPTVNGLRCSGLTLWHYPGVFCTVFGIPTQALQIPDLGFPRFS